MVFSVTINLKLLKHIRYPSELEGYSDASWINHVEDSTLTSGWVFLLGGGAISWASKKQTCITSSTMESEFVALAAAGKEAKWLRNLIHEIPIWPKPIAPISIHCNSVDTLLKHTNSLIPLSRGSFDVLVGMDQLSKRMFVIVCHEKVVEVPLEGSRKLRVQGERTLGADKALINVKVDEPKVGDISVMRDFVDVFPEDLSGLPPQRQVEFRIDLVHGATPVAKSPSRLAPLEMQELSEELREFARQELFLRLRSFSVTYLRFVINFSKIVKPLTSLTERDQKYEWGAEREEAF
ncbi:putative reverse transcriptase domain-containing protein [Tanacetum coccineum]